MSNENNFDQEPDPGVGKSYKGVCITETLTDTRLAWGMSNFVPEDE